MDVRWGYVLLQGVAATAIVAFVAPGFAQSTGDSGQACLSPEVQASDRLSRLPDLAGQPVGSTDAVSSSDAAACLVGIQRAREWLDQPQTLLIDVRRRDAAPLPESLAIPLYAVKAKRYLRERRLILIGDSASVPKLLNECAVLRRAGFADTWVAAGGIESWRGADGAGSRGFVLLPPKAVYQLSRQVAPFVVNIGTEPVDSPLFSDVAHMPLNKYSSQASSVLRRLLAARADDRPVLLIDADGQSVNAVGGDLADALRSYRSYALAGGVSAYSEYVYNSRQMLKAKAERALSETSCPGADRGS